MRLRAAVLLAIFPALAALPSAAQATSSLPTAEARSLDLLNTARAGASLGALRTEPALQAMARAQAVRMAARGQIYHNPNLASDANAAGLDWARVGENVGVGPDADAINTAFLASPHHRENMLFAGYNAIGVGIVPGTGAQFDRIFVAHVFAQLSIRVPTPAARLPTVTRPATQHSLTPTAAKPARPEPAQPSPVASVLEGGLVDRTVVFGGPAVPLAA
jgi:uncharacterized protein YkwD